jgi:hypothetical protein
MRSDRGAGERSLLVGVAKRMGGFAGRPPHPQSSPNQKPEGHAFTRAIKSRAARRFRSAEGRREGEAATTESLCPVGPNSTQAFLAESKRLGLTTAEADKYFTNRIKLFKSSLTAQVVDEKSKFCENGKFLELGLQYDEKNLGRPQTRK